jgi:hypothetical protein
VSDTLDIEYPERDDDEPAKARREGLPPSFRMRHDKHYVEELMSTSTIAQGAYGSPRVSAPASAPVPHERQSAPDGPPRPSTGAVELIARRLESMVAHDAISRAQTPTMDLIGRTVQLELQRVSRFARAVAVSARETEPTRRPVMLGDIAAAVRSACSRVARLNGLDCSVTADDAGFAVSVERGLVVLGITGTVDALLDLTRAGTIEDSDDAGRISVSLRAVTVRPALIVEVDCPSVTWPAAAVSRFFDNVDRDFAAAPAAGILLASAAHVARLHGGRVEVQTHRGLSIRYVFPQDNSAAAPVS